MEIDHDHLVQLSDPGSTALIMWDYQVGLAGKAQELDRVVRTSRRLLSAADAAGVPVIWSQHTLPSPSDVTPGMRYFLMRKQGVAKDADIRPFMQVGSAEREFLPDIQPRPHDTVIEKGTQSFFVGTKAELLLFAKGIRTLVFIGVATEVGIDLSAKHALALGYLPIVVEDAVDSLTLEKQEIGLAALRTWIPVVTTADLIDHWQAQRGTGGGMAG